MNECKIRRRKQGGIDLEELFRKMKVLGIEGKDNRTKSAVVLQPINRGLCEIGDTAYLFSFCDGYLSIARLVVGRSVTPLYQSISNRGGFSMNQEGEICYYDLVDTEVKGASYGCTMVFGATLALVQFDVPETQVDSALRNLQYVTSAGNNSSSLSYPSADCTNIMIGDFVLVAYSNYFVLNRYVAHQQTENLAGVPYNAGYPTMLTTHRESFIRLTGSGSSSFGVNGGTVHVVRKG